jgi:hypothetical protein
MDLPTPEWKIENGVHRLIVGQLRIELDTVGGDWLVCLRQDASSELLGQAFVGSSVGHPVQRGRDAGLWMAFEYLHKEMNRVFKLIDKGW